MTLDIQVITEDIIVQKKEFEKYNSQNENNLRKLDDLIHGKEEVLKCIEKEIE